MYRVFLVEDDEAIASALKSHIESWGLEVVTVSDFARVGEEFAAFAPHVVLLDISLTFYDGYYWCRKIRKTSQVPVIFLSSAADNIEVVLLLMTDEVIAEGHRGQGLQGVVIGRTSFTLNNCLECF